MVHTLLRLALAFVLTTATTTTALRIPFKQTHSSKRSSNSGASFSVYKPNVNKGLVLAAGGGDSDNGLDLNTVHDLIYLANITIGGVDYPMQLDTGSSDLWIKGPSYPLPNTKRTSMGYNLTYGIGWANGSVAYAPVEFAGIKVDSQAFLDVSSAMNPALSYGADGIIGLGFTSLSTIDHLVNATKSSDGRSLLFNMFEDNPSEPNFIAFALQRSTQENDDVEGSFSIGECEEEYKAVMDQPAIPTWPVNSPKRWNVILEAVFIGDKTVTPTTTVANVPGNRAVILLDSGTSYTYAPTEICDAIYGDISGARYDSSLGQWVVPCDAEIDMALQIAGQIFPLHPLDVAAKSLTDTSTCVGTFIPQTVSVGSGQFDWLVGDNVLRSTYSVYDFGDFDSSGKMGNPYVKLLSLTEPNEASSEFVKARGGTARTGITYKAINSTAAGTVATSVDLSSDVAKVLAKAGTYFPAMLGVMALNALVLLGLVIVLVLYMCRSHPSSRAPALGKQTPMMINTSKTNSFIEPAMGAGLVGQAHAYERVPSSGAGDEDLSEMDMRRTNYGGLSPVPEGSNLVPPSPSAMRRQWNDGNNPVSMALSENTLYAPPSPGFKSFNDNDRPKSMA